MSELVPTFPTSFAIAVTQEVDLYYGGDIYKLQRNDEAYSDAMNKHDRLAEFQKFAVLSDFEHALVAYHGVELTEKQKTLLEVVHAHTATFLKGHVVESLIDSLSNKAKNGVDIASLLLETLGTKDGGKGDGLNKLIVELTNKT